MSEVMTPKAPDATPSAAGSPSRPPASSAADRDDRLSTEELRDVWLVLDATERIEGFRMLDRDDAEEFFVSLQPRAQMQIIAGMRSNERRLWMRLLAPDDAADLLQEIDPEQRATLMALLDEPTRREVSALLAYAEDEAGGLMSPRFARVRPDITVDEAIRYLRRQARNHLETIYYAYVLDAAQRLLGVVSFRQLFSAAPDKQVRDIMQTDLVSVPEDMDQETLSRLFARHGFLAIPVVDSEGRMKGIVTIDDIVDVVAEEATEDVQKFGGMEALEAPYMQTGFLEMIKKRAVWLVVLFLGEMLTASAMTRYEDDIHRAVVLAVFIPLIIASGGNSGSQASTLLIRAMALGEVKLRDWWRIFQREILAGLCLGLILAAIGMLRIVAWQGMFGSYGEHYLRIGATVAISLIGVVTWGTLTGSMLPFVLRRLGLDPASASAPLVATMVDVLGLVIYFTMAQLILGGAML